MESLAYLAFACLLLGMVLVPILFVYRIIGAFFSAKVRAEIQSRKVAYAIWFVVSVLFIGMLNPGGPSALNGARRAKTHAIEESIRIAILAYQTEYDTPPPGKEGASLIKELESENPRGITFLNLKATDKNAKGEALDAWGTPLRITIADPQHPVIQSAGPDKTWGTPDDLDNTGN